MRLGDFTMTIQYKSYRLEIKALIGKIMLIIKHFCVTKLYKSFCLKQLSSVQGELRT